MIAAIQDAYKDATAPAVFRPASGIARFFDGFQIEPPGLADVAQWHNPHARPDACAVRFLGAAGRKQ